MTVLAWEKAWLDRTGYALDSELSDRQVSESGLVPFKANTLIKARSTGLLSGVDAPEYLSYGRTIRYTPRLMFEWRRKTVKVQNHTEAA